MRKNDVRKWLHAVLDLLPVLVIPIFMIFVRNENYQSNISIDVPQYEKVDFNQKKDLTTGFSYSSSTTNNAVIWDNVFLNTGNRIIEYSNLEIDHIYYLKDLFVNFSSYADEENEIPVTTKPRINVNGNYLLLDEPVTYSQRFQATASSIYVTFASTYRGFYFNMVSQLQIFDLTQMFGEGNEPTIEEFDSYFTDSYYPYLNSKIMLINTGDTTFNDNDVGSQMFYTLYNAVDKYFNMGNIFNLNGVYDWFVLNIFNGNYSPSIYVVWQIVLYEFVMDLLFLLYGLFMFFIDSCTNLMERFNCQLRGR